MSNADRDAVLECRSLSRDFHDGERTLSVLKHIDLTLNRGECLAILGRSGSGKSTLLHILGLLDRPTGGGYFFRGEDTARFRESRRNRMRSRAIGFVFQHFHLLPELSVLDNVLLPARIAGCSKETRERAAELLDSMGLGERMTHRPAHLSGGERQRAAIARALINRPEVLLCDEPTGNLDEGTAAQVLDLIFSMAETVAGAMVIVTHDREIFKRAGRRLILEQGALKPESG